MRQAMAVMRLSVATMQTCDLYLVEFDKVQIALTQTATSAKADSSKASASERKQVFSFLPKSMTGNISPMTLANPGADSSPPSRE